VANEIVTTTPTPTTVTPKTGLIDDLGYTNAIIIGTLLVISGIYLFKKKNSDDLH
jgi:fucose permease